MEEGYLFRSFFRKFYFSKTLSSSKLYQIKDCKIFYKINKKEICSNDFSLVLSSFY